VPTWQLCGRRLISVGGRWSGGQFGVLFSSFLPPPRQAAWVRNHPRYYRTLMNLFPRRRNREVQGAVEKGPRPVLCNSSIVNGLRRTESQVSSHTHRDRYRQRHLEKLMERNTSMSLRRFMILE